MRTDTDGEGSARLSRRAFVAVAGVHAGAALVPTSAARTASNDSISVAATETYRQSLQRSVTSYRQANNDRTIEVDAAGTSAASWLQDGTLDILVSGQPAVSAADVASDTDRYLTVTDWAALDLSDNCWRDCLRRQQLRTHWESERSVALWSESDWNSVGTVAHTERAASANRGDTTSAKSVTLVRGTRPYQYARGFGGAGHYPVEDGAIDRDALAERAKRQDVAPLVKLGYVHVDETVVGEDLRPFLRVLDRRPDDSDVLYFPSPAATDGTPG